MVLIKLTKKQIGDTLIVSNDYISNGKWLLKKYMIADYCYKESYAKEKFIDFVAKVDKEYYRDILEGDF